MKRILLLTIGWVLTGGTILFAQKITVSGTVYDAESGEKLMGAQVYEFYSQKGTVTNEFGYFSLTLPASDSIKIGVYYIGYKPVIVELPGRSSHQLRILLEPGEELEEVVIPVETKRRVERDPEVSKVILDAKEIQTVPVILSEPDLIKVVQKLPGVETGTEGSGGMYVRGGGIDQNLILLDDVPIYYMNHLGGFISIFHPEIIKKVTLYKGGFPVRYGGRLSSVLDIRTKDGNKKEWHGSYGIGVLSWKFSVEGPLRRDKTSLMLAARRFPYDFLMKYLTGLDSDFEETAGYTFYDINAKINHVLSSKDQVYLSWYYGDDAIVVHSDYPDEKGYGRIGWGNHLWSVKWIRELGPQWFMNMTGSYSRYRLEIKSVIEGKTEDYKDEVKYYSGIYDYRLHTRFEYHPSEETSWETGIGAVYYVFKPGVISIKAEDTDYQLDTTISEFLNRSPEVFAYGGVRKQWSDKWETETGIRTTAYFTDAKTYISVEPRLSIKYMLSENSSVKGAYSLVSQNLHLLTSSNLGMPTDMWMPSTSLVPPGRSWQIAGGYYRTFGNGKYDLSWEIYYKELLGLITYKPGGSLTKFAFTNWEYAVATGGFGRSYGSEILLRKRKGKWTGALAYTWAKSTRRFDEINHGKPYPFRYDRRHALDITANYSFKPGKTFSIAWTYGSGYPFSMPVGQVYVNFGQSAMPVLIYTEKNNYRMRPYHRLDIGMQFTKKKKKGIRTWQIGIYNVYNRKNPFYYYLMPENPGYKLYQVSLFPILPSVAYSYRF